MTRFLLFALWAGTAIAAVLIVLIAAYVAGNTSGHTGWEPFTSFFLFVPLALAGALSLVLRRKLPRLIWAGLCALIVGLAGVAFIVALDQSNRLVEYGRWIERDMP
jgi:amino acid transporter